MSLLISQPTLGNADNVYLYCVNTINPEDKHYLPIKYLQDDIWRIHQQFELAYRLINKSVNVSQYTHFGEMHLTTYDTLHPVKGLFYLSSGSYRQSIYVLSMPESDYQYMQKACMHAYGKNGFSYRFQGYDRQHKQWYLVATKSNWSKELAITYNDLQSGYVSPWYSNGFWWVDSQEVNYFIQNHHSLVIE